MTLSPLSARRIAPTLFVLALAIGGPARAATALCNNPPLFDLSGTACGVAKQAQPCGCSECLTWDPAQGATWYEVRRCNPADGTCVKTGDTRWKNRTGHQARMWCVAWDSPFPNPGIAYDYSVRSCKDGASGPICATALSNSVRYVGAPYMCVDEGIEVPCSQLGGIPSSLSPMTSEAPDLTDLDQDGVTDAMDTDHDGDVFEDFADNCPRALNLGQRDADRDGIGDVCDLEPRVASTNGPADADADGVPDLADLCAAVYDPAQLDRDLDRVGDACDNCVGGFNENQSDSDRDGEGDRCDVDDRELVAVWASKTRVAWESEESFSTYSVYRGDILELREGAGYTQAAGTTAQAARWCSIGTTGMDDAWTPATGASAFYLVAGLDGTVDGGLGIDGDGRNRPNTQLCP